MPVSAILKDPLTHFLIAGLTLFVLISAFHPPKRNDEIFVDKQSLLTFYQYRTNVFEENAASSVFARLDDDEKQQLLTEYVLEEALVREARKLRLDENDYIIRRRMAQKTEYLAGASAPIPAPSDQELMDAYKNMKSEFFSPQRITFTHIFFSSTTKNAEQIVAEATSLLPILRSKGANFDNSGDYGDRFPYHRNYVERSFEYVTAHFGVDAATAIFTNGAALDQWRGPILSEHGAHLVFVSAMQPSRQSTFAEVKPQVKKRLLQSLQMRTRDKALQEVIAAYAVTIDPALLEDGWPTYRNE